MEAKEKLKDKYIDPFTDFVSLNAYRDFKNSLDTAMEEGIAKGKAEGLAEGEIERLKLEKRIAELEKQLKEKLK